MLAVIEHIVALQPQAAALLADIAGEQLIESGQIHAPTEAEKATPATVYQQGAQIPLFSD